MATNRLVSQVPQSGGFGSSGFDEVYTGASPVFELGNALNAFTPYGTVAIGLKWGDVLTPPALPRQFYVQLWDEGTNSLDGQLPPRIAITNVRIRASAGSGGTGISNSDSSVSGTFTMRGLVENGGDHFSASNTFTVGEQVIFDFATSPMTGLAWTRAELFASQFGMTIDSVDDWGAPNDEVIATFFNPVYPTAAYLSNHATGFEVIVTYTLVPPLVTSVTPTHGVPGQTGIEIAGSMFIDGYDEGSICAPGTSVVSAGGTLLTCTLPAVGEADVAGVPFDPGPYDVVVNDSVPLTNAFTGEIMTTVAVPLSNAVKQFFDADGAPLALGWVYTYVAGSNTPQATYSDPALTAENDNPTQLDSAGRCVMYMLPTTYKINLTDVNGVTQGDYPQDNGAGSIWPGALAAQVTTTPAINANSLGHQFTATMNKASMGTHALFAANYFAAPTIGVGGATLTEAATVYIAGPPTLGTSVYSLHVAAGISKFSGAVQATGGFTGNTGFYGTTPIAQQLLATGAGHSVDNVITALQALGLVKQA